jgi:hypothetical protein
MFRVAAVLLVTALSVPANAQEDPALTSAVYRYLAEQGDNSRPDVRTFSFDLDDDRRSDAIVLLTGTDWCGSGGCNMLIFKGTETGFSFVSESTITKEPVAVLPEVKYGWHTLIVMSGGVGNVLMQFNGRKYPFNPSVQPRASSAQINEAQVLDRQMRSR